MPNVGKSTLFKALTKKQVVIENYPFATIDPNVGVVAVPDERIQKLSEFSKSKKTIPASIEFVDIAGLVKGAHEGEGLGNKFLSHIREVDAVCEVVRAFEDENIIHVSGKTNPLHDIDVVHTELMYADLQMIESILPKIDKLIRSGDAKAKEKYEALRAAKELLEKETFASHAPEEIQELIKEYNLLTAKPFMLLLNVKDTDVADTESFKKHNFKSIVQINTKLEEEISEMDTDDMKSLSRIDSLIQAAFDTVGLITFFTTGEDETRSWPIPRDSTAPRAGRAIHSDFEEKFIRAEVIAWDTLLNTGSYAKAREQGLLRTEGKQYIVKDGDVVEFKI